MKRILVLVKNSTVYTSNTAPNQCKAEGHPAYNYELEVRAHPYGLDENDFLIDHTILHNVIHETINHEMGSCERLCLNIERELLKTLLMHGCYVKKIIFAIKPVDSNAWIRFEADYEKQS